MVRVRVGQSPSLTLVPQPALADQFECPDCWCLSECGALSLDTVPGNGIQERYPEICDAFLLKILRKPVKLYRNSHGLSNRSRFDSNG